MLEQITNLSQLKKIDVKSLPILCEELRNKLICDVKHNGGHLASNLGVVELTVALHYVFDEDDQIVWDVGHQSYVHKMLTGRLDSFDSLRQNGGISGFPDCNESKYDCFNTGHAGTAISAALGLAKARDALHKDYKVIAVVGDGSMSCGMSFEALNNVNDTNMLVVFNDNNMSISKSVGSATLNMSKIRVGKYDKRKEKLKKFLSKIPFGKGLYRFGSWCKRKVKSRFAKNSYFDNFNLKYVGIVDGNDVIELVKYLTKIRDNVTKPTLLHVVTKKGKGYLPAENDPEGFHNYTPTNSRQLSSRVVVGDNLCKLAEEGYNLNVVCAAMTSGMGFSDFAVKYPNLFFDCGIAEEHAVTFAAGLAKGGVRPFVGVYSTFLQRSYDQILHDVALQSLPVTFLVEHAGFVGDDGQTHQGLFDLSYLSNIPNIKVWTPCTYSQLSQMLYSSCNQRCPVAIRYPATLLTDKLNFDGTWSVIRHGGHVKILAVGPRMLQVARQVADEFDVEVVAVTCVKPLDVGYLSCVCSGATIITLEENVINGGFGSAVATYFSSNSTVSVVTLGVDDKFVKHATVQEQIEYCNLDSKYVKSVVKKLI